MSRTSLANGAAVALALAASVASAGVRRPPRVAPDRSPAALVDATGEAVPVVRYARIASGSTVADRLLVELCAPERVVAFTAASADGDPGRFDREHRIASIDDVEEIVALRPDLVLVHNVADRRRVERLRDTGLTVFDLGPLEGLRTLRGDVRAIAALCGDAARGDAWWARFEGRLRAVARDLPPAARKEAIYLSVYGGRFFGGTTGTSYHDVLVAAGLIDAAEARHTGWPQYAVEQILELDPEVLVTRPGMREAICGHPVLARLRACAAGLVEIDGDLLDSPGPGMVEAAEAVHAAVYR